jgi:5-methylcytosine-specific restriction endonuclease McrA
VSRTRDDEGYREQALKLYPWLCARCGREFGGKNLRELTVHHKDHDHDNNPRDGSNWELLCLYCHDEEHAKYVAGQRSLRDKHVAPATHKPFANLEQLLKGKRPDGD